MEYHPDEYPSRFCPESERSKRPTGLMLGVIVVGLVTAMGFVGAVADKRKPMLNAKDEQAAPLCRTWICQKYHNDERCGQRHNTACTTAADLTRTK